MARWLCILLAITLALPAAAFEFRRGTNVNIGAGEVIDDDVIVNGSTVTVAGRITGDLVVAGGTVNVSGSIGRDLIAAGGTVNITGPVAGTIYAAGGTINMESTAGRNTALAGGTVNINSAANVTRDLAATGGTVNMAGTTGRDFLGSGGTLNVGNSAHIGGNLLASAGAVQIANGATITGQRIIQSRQPVRRKSPLAFFLYPLIWALLMLPLGLVFVAAAPRLSDDSAQTLRLHPWGSLLAGFLLFLIALPAFIILLITFPLALVLAALYFVLLMLSHIVVAIWIGLLILRRSGASRYLAVLIGIAILALIQIVPVLGQFVMFIALLLGLGALILAIQGRSGRPILGSRAV